MSSIFINTTDQGTWDCDVGNHGSGLVLAAEKTYPVEVYYSRFDLNGSSILERDICKNRDDLMEALKWHGKCNHLIEQVWDFKLDSCENDQLAGFFKETYCRAMDRISAALEEVQEDTKKWV